ncbi:hypothetical protein L345_11954, partial [Ophiophagus hannah]
MGRGGRKERQKGEKRWREGKKVRREESKKGGGGRGREGRILASGKQKFDIPSRQGCESTGITTSSLSTRFAPTCAKLALCTRASHFKKVKLTFNSVVGFNKFYHQFGGMAWWAHFACVNTLCMCAGVKHALCAGAEVFQLASYKPALSLSLQQLLCRWAQQQSSGKNWFSLRFSLPLPARQNRVEPRKKTAEAWQTALTIRHKAHERAGRAGRQVHMLMGVNQFGAS